jgi:hypothetical protein
MRGHAIDHYQHLGLNVHNTTPAVKGVQFLATTQHQQHNTTVWQSRTLLRNQEMHLLRNAILQQTLSASTLSASTNTQGLLQDVLMTQVHVG